MCDRTLKRNQCQLGCSPHPSAVGSAGSRVVVGGASSWRRLIREGYPWSFDLELMMARFLLVR